MRADRYEHNGKELVFYHGTGEHINSFSPPAYFTSDKTAAKRYGQIIYEAYLRVQNPLILEGKPGTTDYYIFIDIDETKMAEYKDMGYDSVIYYGKLEDTDTDDMVSAVIFETQQVEEIKEIGGLFHGSNKEFTGFNMQKTGTGHGRLIYGWGVYVTNDKELAETYPGEDGPHYIYSVTLHKHKPEKEYDYLEWNNAITAKQKEKIVRQAVKEKKYGAHTFTSVNDVWENQMTLKPDLQGSEYMYHIADRSKEGSEFLLRAGISGVHVNLVQGDWRQAWVVFDGNDITIDDVNRFEIGGLFHGSPNLFKKFSNKKIGEAGYNGDMPLGWGFYFAKDKSSATFYAIRTQQLNIHYKGKKYNSSNYQDLDSSGVIKNSVLMDYLDAMNYPDEDDAIGTSKQKVIEHIEKEINTQTDSQQLKLLEQAKEFIEKHVEIDRFIYKVTLAKDRPHDFLSAHEKPTGPQIEKIKTALLKKHFDIAGFDFNVRNGLVLYEMLEYEFTGRGEPTSKFLFKAGIDGIYDSDPDYGHETYVAFDESIVTIEEVEKFDTGGSIPQKYKKLGFQNVGEKKKSTLPEKKWMVLAKKGDTYKVVHGGQKGMQDFSQHHSEERRKRFWQRMGGENSERTKDPFSPLYWHKKFKTWEHGGVLPDNTIKVAWLNSDKPEELESKMFEDIDDARKFAEKNTGGKYLIMELTRQKNNYYRWSLLPYGMHREYKTAIFFDKYLPVIFGEGGSTGLLAPNGKPSNLTPEQWHLVRTPEFKAWFGDWENDPDNASKVIDENGEPLVVYHGTHSDFNVFSKSKEGGYFFVADKKIAEIYAIHVRDGMYQVTKPNKNPKILTCFLSIKDPSIQDWSRLLTTEFQERRRKIRDAKNFSDGMIIINSNDIQGIYDQYVAFNSNQIKLADCTNTTFDGTNPDIRFEEGGSTKKFKTEKELEEYLSELKKSKKRGIFIHIPDEDEWHKQTPAFRLLNVIKLNQFPSASSIECFNGIVYITGDDARNLLVTDTDYKTGKLIPLFPGTTGRIPKPEKPDLEASCIYKTGDDKFKLLMLGSASTPVREIAMLADMKNLDFETYSTSDFFDKVKKHGVIKEINIEGVTAVQGLSLLMACRGNLSNPANYLISTGIDFYTKKNAGFKVFEIELPQGAGVSELHYINRYDMLLFTASTENAPDSYNDGIIGESYVGYISNVMFGFMRSTGSTPEEKYTIVPDKVIPLSKQSSLFKGQKIEGICVERMVENLGDTLLIDLAADNDDGTSTVFNCLLKLPLTGGTEGKNNDTVQTTYYNSHGRDMSWLEFVETEVNDRKNYPRKEVNSWKKKYAINNESRVIWVTPNPKVALYYQAVADSYHDLDKLSIDEFEKKYDVTRNDLAEYQVPAEGFIIPESDDGDNGYLLVIKGEMKKGGQIENNESSVSSTGKYWGKAGAGVLLFAKDTGRCLLLHRSAFVFEPFTWGIISGKLDIGETPEQAAMRELEEEIGEYKANLISLKPSYVFKDEEDGFIFHNFIGVVENEFEPTLNWENTDYAWVSAKNLPHPLHFGVEKLLYEIDIKK